MSVVNFKIAPQDQESIGLAVELDGAEVARTYLKADNLDHLVRVLGQHRAAILPVLPDQPDLANLPVLAVQAYGFAEQKEGRAPELLVIKHPMFGWIGFTFPDEAAAEIAARLQAQAAADADGPPKAGKAKKPN
jgi:hypothetical protein